MRWHIVGLVILSSFSFGLGRKAYVLDPERAESILSTIPDRPRLTEDQWLKIIGGRPVDAYKVKKGETLSSIAKKLFGNPKYWNKFWELNPVLGNPHELEVGQYLRYFRDMVARSPASNSRVVKLSPTQNGIAVDSAEFRNQSLHFRYVVPLLVLSPDEKIHGEIMGATSNGQVLDQHPEISVKFFDVASIRPGDRFSVVENIEKISSSQDGAAGYLGNLVRHTGEVEVEEVGDEYTKVRCRRGFAMIKRGNVLIAQKIVEPMADTFDPPDDFVARVLMGEDPQYAMFQQGQFVIINKGFEQGMKRGFGFRVPRDVDPATKRETIAKSWKAEIQVIDVGARSSIGIIVRNSEPILKDDRLLPRQVFLDPPIYPHRSGSEVVIE